MNRKITIEVPDEACRVLLRKNRKDLMDPPCISIDLACQMYPWLKEILDKITEAVGKQVYDEGISMLWDAILSLEDSDNI